MWVVAKTDRQSACLQDAESRLSGKHGCRSKQKHSRQETREGSNSNYLGT